MLPPTALEKKKAHNETEKRRAARINEGVNELRSLVESSGVLLERFDKAYALDAAADLLRRLLEERAAANKAGGGVTGLAQPAAAEHGMPRVLSSLDSGGAFDILEPPTFKLGLPTNRIRSAFINGVTLQAFIRADGRIVDASESMAAALGPSRADMCGARPIMLFDYVVYREADEFKQVVKDVVKEVVKGEGPGNGGESGARAFLEDEGPAAAAAAAAGSSRQPPRKKARMSDGSALPSASDAASYEGMDGGFAAAAAAPAPTTGRSARPAARRKVEEDIVGSSFSGSSTPWGQRSVIVTLVTTGGAKPFLVTISVVRNDPAQLGFPPEAPRTVSGLLLHLIAVPVAPNVNEQLAVSLGMPASRTLRATASLAPASSSSTGSRRSSRRQISDDGAAATLAGFSAGSSSSAGKSAIDELLDAIPEDEDGGSGTDSASPQDEEGLEGEGRMGGPSGASGELSGAGEGQRAGGGAGTASAAAVEPKGPTSAPAFTGMPFAGPMFFPPPHPYATYPYAMPFPFMPFAPGAFPGGVSSGPDGAAAAAGVGGPAVPGAMPATTMPIAPGTALYPMTMSAAMLQDGSVTPALVEAQQAAGSVAGTAPTVSAPPPLASAASPQGPVQLPMPLSFAVPYMPPPPKGDIMSGAFGDMTPMPTSASAAAASGQAGAGAGGVVPGRPGITPLTIAHPAAGAGSSDESAAITPSALLVPSMAPAAPPAAAAAAAGAGAMLPLYSAPGVGGVAMVPAQPLLGSSVPGPQGAALRINLPPSAPGAPSSSTTSSVLSPLAVFSAPAPPK